MPRVLLKVAISTAAMAVFSSPASAEDVSAPAILQWFEASYDTMERRSADVFATGYGVVWTPPPGRADTGNFSVGYDVYDRFDLGSINNPTLYGTETGLKNVAGTFDRAGLDLHIDFVINHNGYSGTGNAESREAFRLTGDYPGFVTSLPGDVDGDFHGAFQGGDHEGRLAGLIDIAHEKNHRFIRNPVTPGDSRNIPAGTRTDIPTEANRRLYPDADGPFISVFDPKTGEQNIRVYSFNTSNPSTGDAVEENATGLLMRNAQWLVQTIGVDGFRIDAAKHVPTYVLEYFDRSVYRSDKNTLLDGSAKHVFSYGEVFDGNRDVLLAHTRKDIDPIDPGRIGGNRDALDFAQFFAMRDNLKSAGIGNDWRNVVNAGMDVYDDGLRNGSRGVLFAGSHDEPAPELSNVAHAYTLMQPGNAVVYLNGKEFGGGRNFPKDGRGDALGGRYGDSISKLVEIRNTHGRGNYKERWLEEQNYGFEREKSALVLLSNRGDGGFDTRRMDVGFAWGTTLVELTGNAAADANIAELVTVDDDEFGGQTKATVRFRRNDGGDKGYLVYGLATPRSQNGIELGGVSQVLTGGDPTQGGGTDAYRNGTTRLADVHVVTGNSFNVKLQTQAVTLTGTRLEGDQLVQRSIRDRDADGDNALLKIDAGLDANGNGQVDFVTPGSVVYGFEQFQTAREPGYTNLISGDGRYEQIVDATQLGEGYHFIEARAFRRRDDGGPAVYTPFKETIYVDRFKPISGVDRFVPVPEAFGDEGDNDVWLRSLDQTADSVHAFLNLPANVTAAQIDAMVANGQGRALRIDRDVFNAYFDGMGAGNNVLTLVTFEITGNKNIQRLPGFAPASARGAGLGDLNHDDAFAPGDLAGTTYGFERVLYSRNTEFNPAADLNADGLVDNRDLYQLKARLAAVGADESTQIEYTTVLRRRGNINGAFGADAFDIDALYARRGKTGDNWFEDLNVDGVVTNADVDVLVETIFETAFGDANLDQMVSFADLTTLLNYYNQAGGWATGDFDGSALVGFADLTLLLNNYNFGVANMQQGVLGSAEYALLASHGINVPEPASLATVAFASLLLARRRRSVVLVDVDRT